MGGLRLEPVVLVVLLEPFEKAERPVAVRSGVCLLRADVGIGCFLCVLQPVTERLTSLVQLMLRNQR